MHMQAKEADRQEARAEGAREAHLKERRASFEQVFATKSLDRAGLCGAQLQAAAQNVVNVYVLPPSLKPKLC